MYHYDKLKVSRGRFKYLIDVDRQISKHMVDRDLNNVVMWHVDETKMDPTALKIIGTY